MIDKSNKHEHYELLNLLGYGLAKFNNGFIEQFNCKSKEQFYQLFVDFGIVETRSVVKNRQDLFDPYFDNGRQGWWQKKDVYEHRKILIDSLFGLEDVVGYADIVKLILKNNYKITDCIVKNSKIQPIIQSKFQQMQKTGLEAELYFMNNYQKIEVFNNGVLQDARLFGDGYDFQVQTNVSNYLIEVKGIRKNKGEIRLTENEFLKAQEYQSQYMLIVILNLSESPKFWLIDDPIKKFNFKEIVVFPKPIKEYHLKGKIG